MSSPDSTVFINVKNNSYANCVGDGVTEDSGHLQTIINAVSAFIVNGNYVGATLFFPPGYYLISQQINVLQQESVNIPITFLGSGDQSTVFYTKTINFYMFNIDTSFVNFFSVGFLQEPFQTSGSNYQSTGGFILLNTNGGGFTIRDFSMQFPFIGITVLSNGVYIENGGITSAGYFTGPAPFSGYGVFINSPSGDVYLNNLFLTTYQTPALPGNWPNAGVFVANGSVNIANCDIINQHICLLMTSGSLYAVDSYFDSSDYGIYLNQSGSSSIFFTHFVGCWTSNHFNSGVFINAENPSTGSVNSIEFIGHHALLNGNVPSSGPGVGDGFTILKATNIKIADSEILQNVGSGIALSGNSLQGPASTVIITGNTIGILYDPLNNSSQGPPNQQSNISLTRVMRSPNEEHYAPPSPPPPPITYPSSDFTGVVGNPSESTTWPEFGIFIDAEVNNVIISNNIITRNSTGIYIDSTASIGILCQNIITNNTTAVGTDGTLPSSFIIQQNYGYP